ncbi:MAG: serine/threonine-protein kinase [Myxococcota bacterium]
MVGRRIERYRIESVLGEGASAVVYRAVHVALGSHHAVKVARLGSERARRRLLHEGRAQARVRHPNLVAVTDVVQWDGQPALVLELVDGPSLADWLAERRPKLPEALAVFRGIVLGVQAAHEAGLVHRDLKPANVLLAATELGWVPKVADFGSVHDLGDEDVERDGLGTVGYTAPEQRAGAPADERSDLFALGCVLYELATGAPAFSGPDVVEVGRRVASGRYPPPEDCAPALPANVVVAIHRLLAVDPHLRLGSCDELLELLYGGGSSLDQAQVAIRPARATAVVRPALAPRSRWWTPAAVACLMAPLAAWALLTGPIASPEPGPGDPPSSTTSPRPSGSLRASIPPRIPLPPPAAAVRPARADAPPPATLHRSGSGAGGTVNVVGDGLVWLTGADGRRVAPGQVPVGSWRWEATFGTIAGPSGVLTVEPGETVTVRCSSFAMRCRVD